MREIKFRGYSTKDNEWRYGFYVTDNITHEILTKLENNEMYASQIDFISLGQYTGLKDKNGVDIYEGDIIKYDFNKLNYRIEFVNAEFIARRFCENIENLYPSEFDYGKECEVIENIYEHPELLEGVK